MASSITVCGYPPCRQSASSAFKPQSLPSGTMNSGFGSSLSSDGYCSEAHLREHAGHLQRVYRSVARSGMLLAKIFLKQREAFPPFKIHSDALGDDGRRRVGVEWVRPGAGQPVCGQHVSEEGRVGALLANSCVDFITQMSGGLVFLMGTTLSHQSLHFSEIHIDPTPHKILTLQWNELDQFGHLRVVYEDITRMHTIIRVAPGPGLIKTQPADHHGVVIEGTRPQHRERQAVLNWQTHRHQIASADALSYSTAFGTSYRGHEARFESGNVGVYEAEAILRTTNNVLYREVMSVGGPQALNAMNDAMYSVAEGRIITAVGTALVALRAKIDWACQNGGDWRAIVQACAGVGDGAIKAMLAQRRAQAQ